MEFVKPFLETLDFLLGSGVVTIGQRVSEALKMSGKTPAELARHLKTGKTTVHNWVNVGRVPASDVIVPICEFTGVSPEWLLTGEGEVSPASVQEAALLGVFRALPPAGREVALKQVVALVEAFPEASTSAEGTEKKEKASA